MTWSDRGVDRLRKFKLYRELEANYHKTLEENAKLRLALEKSNRLIVQMAREVHRSLDSYIKTPAGGSLGPVQIANLEDPSHYVQDAPESVSDDQETSSVQEIDKVFLMAFSASGTVELKEQATEPKRRIVHNSGFMPRVQVQKVGT